MTSVRMSQPYVSPAVQNPTFPTVTPEGIKEVGFCQCGYPQPCVKTVPVGFCTGGGMIPRTITAIKPDRDPPRLLSNVAEGLNPCRGMDYLRQMLDIRAEIEGYDYDD